MGWHRLYLAAAAIFLLLIPAASLGEPLPQESRDQLGTYDLSAWEAYYQTLPESVRQVWDGASLTGIIERIASGEGIKYENVFTALGGAALAALRKSMGAYAILMGTALLSCVADILCGGKAGISDIVSFLCFGMSAAAVSYALMQQVSTARLAIASLTAFMEIATPVMAFALTAVGSVTLSGAIQPLMAFLGTTVAAFFKNIILPLTAAGGTAVIIGALSQKMGLTQLHRLIKSAVKWLTGAVFTVYFGVVAIQGLSMGGADSITLRAAKYALDKSVPIVGGAMSGTLETVLGSAVLIKNAVGAAAMALIMGAVFSPLLQIASAGFACKVAAAICAPIGDERIPKLLTGLSEVYNNLFAAVTAVALMFMILAGLVMAAGNV